MKLIVAAERLFAEHGFDGVTMKQITAEAGQRNASALHYHFGSKQALVEAIVAHRMPAVNARREALLDDLVASGRDGDVRAVLEALVRPAAELLDGREEGRYWVRFLVQVWNNPRSGLADVVPSAYNTSILRGAAMLAGAMREIPEAIIQQRLSLLSGIVIQTLVDYERFGAGDLRRPGVLSPVFLNGLLDMLAAMVTAPVSNPTRGALDEE